MTVEDREASLTRDSDFRGTGTRGSFRQQVGTLLLDRPIFGWPLGADSLLRQRWISFHNRRERLSRNPTGQGYDCDWEWTSDLTIASVFPRAGRSLLRIAFAEWPLGRLPSSQVPSGANPDVTFIVGHRGAERLPLLLATVASLEAQTECSTEVVVVEQDRHSILEGRLPRSVRLVHQPLPRAAMPYSRSWAFNRGAKEAAGRILAFHDNDVLVPASYARELKRVMSVGWEAAQLQRFVFYLDASSTSEVVSATTEAGPQLAICRPELVRQNCKGHTIAVTREAYFRIGGHDEGFLGWGGEDNEFYDRCRLLRFHPWGYLPFLHLWHAPQPEKIRPGPAPAYFEKVMKLPREERARRLAGTPIGRPEGPSPPLVF